MAENISEEQIRMLEEAFRRNAEATQAATDEELAFTVAMREAKRAAVGLAKSFTDATMEGGGKLSSYGKSLDTFGSAIGSVTHNLGPLAQGIGLAVEGFSKLAKIVTEQTDNALKASDQISRMGAANAYSTKNLIEMANKAGLTSKEFDKMIKPMQSLGGAVNLIGNTSGEGVKKFNEMISTTAEVRKEFQRLGYNDEERIEAQKEYIAMMAKTGSMESVRLKTGKQLEEASLEYTKNLTALSVMTGKDAEKAKSLQMQAQANMATQMQYAKWNKEEAELRRQGKTEEADAIAKRREGFKQMITDVAAVAGPAKAAGAAMYHLTGAVTKESTSLQLLGVDLDKHSKAVNDNTYVMGSAADDVKDSIARTTDQLGEGTVALSGKVQESFGLTLDTMTNYNNLYGKKMAESAANVTKDIEDNAAGIGPAATDPAQKFRGALTETQRSIKLWWDNLIKSANPFVSGFTPTTVAMVGLTTAALAAAAALGKIGIAGGIGKFGKGAGKGAPPSAPTGAKPGGAGTPGPSGGMSAAEKLKYDKLRAEGMSAAAAKKQALGFKGLSGPKPPPVPVPPPAAVSTAAKEASKLASATKVLGKMTGGVMAAASVGAAAYETKTKLDEIEAKKQKKELTEEQAKLEKSKTVGGGVGGAAGGLGGSWAGGMAGAAIGTAVMPGVGTVIGGLIGAALAGWAGSAAGEAVGEKIGESIGKNLTEQVKEDVKTGKLPIGATSAGGGTTAMPGQTASPTVAKASAPSSAGGGAKSAPPAGAAAGGGSSTGPAAAGGSLSKEQNNNEPPGSGSTNVANMSDDEIKKMIIRHEGIRTKPYKDSLGLWTVGVGHLIGDGKSLPPEWNREFSNEEVMALFDKDYEEHKKAASSNIPNFDRMSGSGKGAFTDLTFNMGPNWLSKWPNTKKAIEEKNNAAIAAGLENSQWYKQVGLRAPEIVAMAKDAFPQARYGGIFSGPDSGYPVILHGRERVTPFNKRPSLDNGGTVTKSELPNSMNNKPAIGPSIESILSSSMDKFITAHTDMMNLLSEKLDQLDSRLEKGNDIQKNILTYSM